MKILLVNKFHYLRGGSEKYYFELAKLLKENGHEVAFFSMYDEKNIKTGEKEYFVNKINLNSNNIFKALDVIYSKKNKKKIKEAIEEFKPDIVHINNFQRQLSASIIDAIKEKNIPIVFTVHDLQIICPAINMLDKNQKICDKCITGKYMNCIKNKCNKSSYLKSTLGALEGYFYKKNKIYTEKIDAIISPSEFYRQRLIKDGISENKIKVLHNFAQKSECDIETTDEGFALYVGRLSKEKGIINLIEAFKKIDKGILYIAGEGIEKEKIEEIIYNNKLQDRIKLLGYLNEEEIKEQIRKCSFVIIPSIWHENCPYSLMEALIIGKPVIGTKVGGIAELIIDGKTGFLYELDNLEELSKKIDILLKDKNLASELGKNAKKYAIKEFSRESYYNEIMKIYNKLIEGARE